MKTIALIPARSGSKGVINKNIKNLGGLPLIAYSIIAAKMIPNISDVIVSTDSHEYAKIANKYGAKTPFLRPKSISKASSTDLEMVEHFLNWYKQNMNEIPHQIIHLRPTTPLRDPKIIKEAIQYINQNGNSTSLRSGHKASESPFKWFMKGKNGFFKPMINGATSDEINRPRQDFPDVFIPNGYVDIIKSDTVFKTKSLHGKNMLVFESSRAYEIDNNDDFSYLEYELKKKGSPIIDFIKSSKI